MPSVRISKRAVDAIETTGREYFVWDTDLPGFGVRVRETGAKTYIAQYRREGGRVGQTRRLTLGATNKLTPDEARKIAKEKLAEAARGGDPAAEKSERRTGVSVAELAEAFLTRHVDGKRKANTAIFYRGVLDTHVLPTFGGRRAIDVTRGDAAKLHNDLRVKKTVKSTDGHKRVIGGPFVANRVMAVLAAMYTWGGKSGLLPEGINPASKVEKYREEGRERYLTSDELGRLGDAIREAETTGIDWEIDEERAARPTGKHIPKRAENRRTVIGPHAAGALRLLIMTGARLREILHLQWSQVDIERGLLFLPDSKTGKKTIVLNAPAMAVLANLPRIGKYVISGAGAGEEEEKPRSDLKRPWELVSKRAGLDGVRLHDLRHTNASFGAAAGLGLPIIGKLLGHTQSATTARYAHLDNDPLRKASERIGSDIARAMGETPSASRHYSPDWFKRNGRQPISPQGCFRARPFSTCRGRQRLG